MIAFPDTPHGNVDYLEGMYGFHFAVEHDFVDDGQHFGSPFANLEEAVLLITMRFSGIWAIDEDGELVF